jgi:hypothetical protein
MHPARRIPRTDRQAMIVEPTPVHPRSPFRRALRAIALATPAVLLLAAVGAGIAGPKPTPPPEALVGLPTPSVAASPEAPSPSPSPSPSVAQNTGAAQVAFPSAFGRLLAIRPSEVLAARLAGTTPDVVVVAGFMDIDWVDLACKDAPLGAAGPWCERRGTLYEAPIATLGNTGPGGRPTHLHLTIPIGVRIPDAVAATEGGTAGSTVPAVLVGEFAPGSSCGGGQQACDQGFVVDRVTWAGGLDVALVPLVEPPLDIGRRANPFTVAPSLGVVPLEAVLAWPRTIASLDAGAGAVAAQGPPSEPLWFMRVIAGVGTGVGTSTGAGLRAAAPHVAWVLLDEPHLDVIASGPTTAPMGGTASGPAVGG